ATYRQRSDDDPSAFAVDPEDKLLWRMTRDRLDFEATRDAMLATSGDLDLAVGGRPADVAGTRRTVYALVDRQFLPGVFRTFDFANPDIHVAVRHETTVPQQALFFLNGAFAASRARELAAASCTLRDEQRIGRLYEALFQRRPSQSEV